MEPRKRSALRIGPRGAQSRDASDPPFAVFTAVDGTLLDARTFEPGASRAAVRRLVAAGIPVIPVSVMTLDEIAPLAADLGLQQVMVIEAGGAIARWNGKEWAVEPCGPPAESLLDVIREIEDRSGANLLMYSALPETDASRLSGRSGEMLRASARRCFTEPFVVESGDIDTVREAAATIGFSVRRGRRFLHLCRESDAGDAFTRVREELRCDTAVALGSAAVDGEFMARADVAIIIPAPDGDPDPELLTMLPKARIAPAPGPEGWAAAVDEVWRSLEIPKRRARDA